MAASTMNLTLQQSLVGKFAKRQPFRSATRAPLRLVRAEDPISPDEGPVSKEIISCKPPSLACCHQGYLHAMEGAFYRRALTSIEHLHLLMQMQRLCQESRTHSQVSASGNWHTSTIAPWEKALLSIFREDSISPVSYNFENSDTPSKALKI